MKYLTTAKPGLTPIPPDQALNLLQASKAWIDAKIADGSLDCTYNFFGGGGFAIGNGDSHEAILNDLLDYPMYPFFTWEVVPLLDYEQSFEQYMNFYKKITGM